MENEKMYVVLEARPETKAERVSRKVSNACAIGLIAISVAPVVCCLVGNGVEWIKYKRKIKKGLKDGSIVEIDGKYYEVELESES